MKPVNAPPVLNPTRPPYRAPEPYPAPRGHETPDPSEKAADALFDGVSQRASGVLNDDGRKQGKIKYELLSSVAMTALADLMTDMGKPKDAGGQGYSPHDWLTTVTISQLISAAERHLAKTKMGVDYEGAHLHATRVMFAGMALAHIMSLKDFDKWDDRGQLGKAEDFVPRIEKWLKDEV